MREMRRLVPVALFAVAIILIAATAVSAGGPKSLDEAKKMAHARGVPLLVNVNAEWSSGCKDFQKASSRSSDIGKALEQVVFYTASGEKSECKALTTKLKVNGLPDFVMLDQNGKMIHCWSGFDRAEEFIKNVHHVLQDPITVEERLVRYSRKPTADDAVVLGRIHAAQYEGKKAIGFYRTACKLDSDRKGELVYPIFEASASGIKGKTIDAKALFQAADDVLQEGVASSEELCHVAKVTGHVAKSAGTPELQKPYLLAAMKATAGTEDEDLRQFRKAMAVSYALVVEGNTHKALQLKRANMESNWMEDAMQLNSFAWWCFENNINLVEADKLARKGADLAPAGKKKAMVLDTVAEICNARGSCNSALKWIELALNEDPENQYYQDQFERFQEIVAQAE